MNKEELAIRTASILRLQIEHDQLISKAEFLQTLIVKERFELESISNPTVENHLEVDDVAVDNTPQKVKTENVEIIESVETIEGVKECLKELSVKTNSRKVSLDILRKFGVEKTVDLDPAFYGQVCSLACDALNEFLKKQQA